MADGRLDCLAERIELVNKFVVTPFLVFDFNVADLVCLPGAILHDFLFQRKVR